MSLQLDSIFDSHTLNKAIELQELISEQPLFSYTDTAIAPRLITYWGKQELVRTQQKLKGKWQTLSFIDYVWLRIVDSLRQIGLPIPVIRQVKDEIFEIISAYQIAQFLKANSELYDKINREDRKKLTALLSTGESDQKHREKGVSLFELLVFETVLNKSPLSLVVFNDGYWFPWCEGNASMYPQDDLERKIYDTHVSVSIAKIIKEFLSDDSLNFSLPSLPIFHPNEVKLLKMISKGEYESITINFKNQKMRSVEMVKAQDVKKKIVDILTENAYQDIMIKTHKGMVTTIKNTVKLQFDED